MMKALEKLNLRPGERRLVVVIAFVLFVVFNIWFVWPFFHDWTKVNNDLAATRQKLVDFRREISQVQGTNGYEARLKKLQGEGAVGVLPEGQGGDFKNLIYERANAHQVYTTQVGQPVPLKTSSAASTFYEELEMTITFVNTEEKNLVEFLYSLGSGTSMVRVLSMTVRPDPGNFKLGGNLTFIASYQRKAPLRPTSATNAVPHAPRPVAATNASGRVMPPTTRSKPGDAVAPKGSGTNSVRSQKK